MRRAFVALLLWLLALAPAMALTTVYEGVTTQLNVGALPGDTYTWEIYTDAPVDFAVVPGNCPVTSAIFEAGNTGASVNVKWLKPGIYFYKVTARDAAFCAMNFKVGMFKVLPFDTKAAITGAQITGACLGVQLDALTSTGDIQKYEWSLVEPGGVLSRTKGPDTEFLLLPDYKGLLPANFNIKLTVTDIRGKTDQTTITIKVDRRPVVNVYRSGLYETDGTMLADGKLSSGTALNYNWFNTGGGIVGSDNQQAAKLYGTGNYTLKITDSYNCSDKTSFWLKFDQIIAVRDHARLSWAQDTIMSVLANDNLPEGFIAGPLRITDLPSMGDATPNNDGTITYTPRDKVPGHDQFVYEVCDAVGNCSSATVNIDIFDSPIFIPEGFSPNGDGKNDHLVFEGLDKYPNSQLYVFTRTGGIVYKSDANGYDNQWDGTIINSQGNNKALVPTGTYYYILKLGGTNRSLKQFIYIGY